jgi:hypothetical protein
LCVISIWVGLVVAWSTDGSWRWTPSGCHVDRLASALLHAPIRRYDDGPRLLSHARPW